MKHLELGDQQSFVDWVKTFFGNRQAENNQFVENLLKFLPDIDSNISIEVHFLHSILDKFPDNFGDVSNQ